MYLKNNGTQNKELYIMTRKHFEAIAKIVEGSTHANDSESINKKYLVGMMCEYFELINNRFDGEKFVKACSIDIR